MALPMGNFICSEGLRHFRDEIISQLGNEMNLFDLISFIYTSSHSCLIFHAINEAL